ncbi:hypothetical protein LXL04_011396 [Taraxacum kok-saghyz]
MEAFREEFQHLKHFNLSEIKSITGDFDKKNIIGEGGFGKVYGGLISESNSQRQVMAAFKRLDSSCGQGDPEFLKEIMLLSCYTHENLISLLGFCTQDGEKILVYEHASHGSLDVHLSSSSLTWTQRLKICLGAARGLCYLHDPNETQQRVIHRDIKSSNILLDNNWNAKVSDMGLAKIGPTNQLHSFLATNVVGTFFYMDPMYMETSILTKESDVYSFGVVLFEVLCGRLCFEYENGRPRSLVRKWKTSYKEKKLEEIIFHDMKQDMDPRSLETFSEIAYGCLQKSRASRPNMSRVVEELEIALQFQQSELEEMVKAAVNIEELEMLLSKTILDNQIFRTKEFEKLVEAAGTKEYNISKIFSKMELNKEISQRDEFEKILTVVVKEKKLEILLSNKEFSEIELIEMAKAAVSKAELEMILAKRFPNNKEEQEYFLSKGILVNGGKTWFLFNKHGEQREMIAADDCCCDYISSENLFYNPVRVSSRFDPPNRRNFTAGFKAHVRTLFLSPGVTYTVNLVFGLEGMRIHPPEFIRYTFAGETKFSTSFITHEREDGWLMAGHLCHFICNKENVVLDITFNCETEVQVEGIEIRSLGLDLERCELRTEDLNEYQSEENWTYCPVDVHYEQVLEEEDANTHPDTYWEQKLPNDWKKILNSSKDSVQWTTHKELYSILCKGFLINSGEKWFYLANNGNKCYMVSARRALPFLVARGFDWKSSPDSRFEKTACDPVGMFRMESSFIELSPETTYAAYLVYKLQQNHSRFESPVEVRVTKYNTKCYIYLLAHQPPIRGKIYQKKRIPQQRTDGWMEVPLWEFRTHNEHASIDVVFEIKPSDNMSFKGLIVEGIDFKPV